MSPLFAGRCGVSAVGGAPLTGTSHSRAAEAMLGPGSGWQDTSMSAAFHQRTGRQPPVAGLVPGTGRNLTRPPALLTSSTPVPPLTTSLSPSGELTAEA